VNQAQYERGVDNLNAVRNTVGPNAPATIAADRALASSLSSEWSTPAGRIEAAKLLRGIRTSVDDYLGQILVQPQSTITITSSKAEIPISFQNTGDDDVSVNVKLESDRLLFPDGAERVVQLPAHRNTTVRVAVETRGSGTAPVLMSVTTADGLAIPKGVRTISVRSTFVSGVGVFLTVAAIVFLALWWGWDIHRRRKKRSLEQHPAHRLAPTGHPA
jgi:hypothetical protein